MKKILPYILLAAGIIIGLSLGGNKQAEKELIKKLESDRAVLFEAISQKDAQIIKLAGESEEIRERMRKDSTRDANALKAEKQATLHYKKLYEKINLSRTPIPELDSLRAMLRASALHPD